MPLAVVSLSDSDTAEAIQVLQSGNLTMGKKVLEFEQKMAHYLNVNHFIMVNSGSSANLLIFEYLLRSSNNENFLKPGDGVLVPSIAWPTTVWPIVQLGLIPVFVDVDRETFQIDLQSAQKTLNDVSLPIKAIFPIHPLGLGLNHVDLEAFCGQNSLLLVNDVCESLGSWHDNVHAGTSGIAASFSFYFSHHITTMEGGGIATNSLDVADDIRSMRSHGWSRDRSDANRWSAGATMSEAKFRFVTTGYNVRPMEVQAAIGLNQIGKIDELIARRRQLAMQVNLACEGTPMRLMGSKYLDSDLVRSHSWMMLPLGIVEERTSKYVVQKYLEDSGVETRPVLTGNFMKQPAMASIKAIGDADSFANTDWVTENCFLIGAHHDYTQDQIDHLLNVIRNSVKLI